MVPGKGWARKSQSYGITPAGVVRRSAGLSSWIVKYRTGYSTPGAGAHTGPDARKVPPAGRGTTKVDLPEAGSSPPTPLSLGEAVEAPLPPPRHRHGACRT